MICSNCKKEIPDDTVLCPYCSYNVTEYDKRESVLSIIKKRANSNNTTGSKPVSHSFKVFIRTLIIVLVILAAIGAVYTTFKPRINFFITGLDSGFSFSAPQPGCLQR